MTKYYLYGLQRSGTNVLTAFLEKNFKIKIEKSPAELRNDIKHKHHRIYDDKSLIPKTDVKGQFNNKTHITTLEDLDELLGDKTYSNHYIIVYKDIFSWLPSIKKWATSCKWKTTKKKDFIEDYRAFYTKWMNIKTNRVLFINYRKYLELSQGMNNDLTLELADFLKCTIPKKLSFPVKVDVNRPFRQDKLNYYLKKKYMELYSPKEIQNLEATNNIF